MSSANDIGELIHRVQNYSIDQFSSEHPHKYFAATILFALAGYLYLLIYPLGIAIGIQNAYSAITTELSVNSFLDFTFWGSVAVLCTAITFRISNIKFTDPEGLELTNSNADPLITMLDGIQNNNHLGKIHKVILSHQYEMKIIKIPMFGIPVWSKNVLIVGFPVLQTMSADNFHSLLTHKLVQYSKKNNLIINWLSSLREIWPQYHVAFKKRGKIGDELMYWFFEWYGTRYARFSRIMAQWDILKGDELTLNKINDRDFFKSIEEYYLTKYFLRAYFWPKINQLMNQKGTPPDKIKVFKLLPKAINRAFTDENIKQWLSNLSYEKTNTRDLDPAFATRMKNIGYTKVVPIHKDHASCASLVFNNNYKLVSDFADRVWSNNQETLIANHNKQGKRWISNKGNRKLRTNLRTAHL